MKGCFFLQRKFAPIGNAIAIHLQNYGVENFCAYATPRTAYDFLASQKEIPYTKIILDEDVYKKYKDEKIDWDYLKKFEGKYGIPNLWPYLYIDRVIMHGQLVREYPHDQALVSHEEMLKILQVTAKEIIRFLEEEKPDFLFISVIGSLAGLLLYQISKKMGIQTIILDYTRIGNGIILTENYKTFSWADKLFDDFQSKKIINPREKNARQFLEKFRNAPVVQINESGAFAKQPTDRIGQLKFLSPKKLLKTVRWLTKFFNRYFYKKERDYTDETPWYSIWDKIKRKIRGLKGFSHYYSDPNMSENFIYFPLHLEPEVSTLLNASFYTNQFHTIAQIAKSMPINFKLYVKEHPVMVGFRTQKYYQEIVKIPGVKLIHPSCNSLKLLRLSKLLISVGNNTAGWEAILLQKPVVAFGDVFFNKLSIVKNCRSFEDLPYLIKNQLENFRHNEEELINYIGAILEDSINADIIDLWQKEDQSLESIENDKGIKELAELLAKKINLVK